MDRVKIKEHIIRNLKKIMGDTPYAITGDYPEIIKTIHVAVSIRGETPLLGEMSSLIDRDEYTGQETRMYVYNMSIGVTVYGPIDEETADIANQIRTAIQKNKNIFLCNDIGVTRIMGVGGLSAPAMTEGGGRKTWQLEWLSIFRLLRLLRRRFENEIKYPLRWRRSTKKNS